MTPEMMDIAPPDADARLQYGAHASQFVDFRRSAGSARATAPLVVVIHGGFWRARRPLTYAGHMAIALGRAGYVTANIEYRRIGEEGGGWPGTFEDTLAAIAFARARGPEFGADPGRTLLVGHSAGGHLALLATAHLSDLRGAVSLAGVARLRRAYELGLGDGVVAEFLGGDPRQAPERYREADPSHYPSTVPRVLLHGTADDIVPCEVSRDFPRPRRYVEVAGADHFAFIDPESAEWPRVVGELDALR